MEIFRGRSTRYRFNTRSGLVFSKISIRFSPTLEIVLRSDLRKPSGRNVVFFLFSSLPLHPLLHTITILSFKRSLTLEPFTDWHAFFACWLNPPYSRWTSFRWRKLRKSLIRKNVLRWTVYWRPVWTMISISDGNNAFSAQPQFPQMYRCHDSGLTHLEGELFLLVDWFDLRQRRDELCGRQRLPVQLNRQTRTNANVGLSF